MKEKARNLFYPICFIILFLSVAFIYPLSDDWYYNTAPNLYVDISDFMPTNTFWRPLDTLFGFLISFCPALFPALNRACVVLAHVISVWLLKKILVLMNVKRKILNFCVLYAMFSSAIIATIVSPDALNQAFSLMFGMAAMYSYFKNQQRLTYAIFSIISLLWKESGIIWLYAIPFLQIMLSVKSIKEIFTEKETRKKVIKAVAVAVLLSVCYFAARFTLQGSVELGEKRGRYAMSVFSLTTVKNFVNIFGNSMSGIDSIALFVHPRSMMVLMITAVLSLAFLIVVFYAVVCVIKQKKNLLGLFTVILTTIIVSAPHIAIGSAGEMHTYPTVFAICIAYGYILNHVDINKKVFLYGAISIFIAFAITGAHKLIATYDYGFRTKAITEEMLTIYDNPNDKLLIVSVDEKAGYSVFSQPAIVGSEYGYSMKPYFRWKNIRLTNKKIKDAEKAQSYIKEAYNDFDKIWIVCNDEIEAVK